MSLLAESLCHAFTRRRPFVDSLRESGVAEPFRQRDDSEDECFIQDVVIHLQQTKGSVFTFEYRPVAWQELLEDGHKSIRRLMADAFLTPILLQQGLEGDGAMRHGRNLVFDGNWVVLHVKLGIDNPKVSNSDVALEEFAIDSFTDLCYKLSLLSTGSFLQCSISLCANSAGY